VGNAASGIKLLDNDLEILSALAEDGEANLQALARKLALPVTTLEYRLQRLKKAQVLRGTRYLVDVGRLGFQPYIHLLTLKGLSDEVHERLRQFCCKAPQIHYTVECLGNWDYEIGSVNRNGKEVIALQTSLEQLLGHELANIQSEPLLVTHKVVSCSF
jgi:DNA-binding Lrp family transcriptional regulator